MPVLDLRSQDNHFGLYVGEEQVEQMLAYCQASAPRETGGILVGFYDSDLRVAEVVQATSAPADSRHGRTWFIRGVRGLQSLINRVWKQNQYYIGEWHFHPFASPAPSQDDEDQLNKIANEESYHCPEPVLLIIGGDPAGDWSARAFVFRRKDFHFELWHRR